MAEEQEERLAGDDVGERGEADSADLRARRVFGVYLVVGTLLALVVVAALWWLRGW